jgi:multidrug efflux pump subunit AcrA (membrane-fusion protein)
MGQWSHRRHHRADQGGGVTGTVRSVPVQDFQKVRSGQAIVELDDADYQAKSNPLSPCNRLS